MSTSLGDMVVSFSGDTSNLSSSINSAQSQISGFGNAVQSQAGGIGGFFSGIVGGIGNFVGSVADGIGSMVDFGKSAFDMGMSLLAPDAQMEQMQVGFKTLFGSTAAAKDMLQQLSDFAAKTPFQMMDLDTSAAKLKAFGEQKNEIIPDLTSIGDTLSALGETTPAKLQQVVDIFGKIDSQGKLTTGIMTQFSRNGINAWQALSDATGKPIATLQEMVHKGLIPASQATDDLRRGLEKMYGGGMLAQSQTFNGLMSTLKDNLEAAWRTASGPLFDMAKGALSSVGNIVGSKQFQDFATTMGKDVAGAFSAVGGAATWVAGVLKSLNLTDFNQAWKDVSGEISFVGRALGGLVSSLKPVGDSLDPLAEVIANFAKGGLSIVTNLLYDLSGAFLAIYKATQGGGGLGALIPSGLQTALSAVTGLFKTLGGVWNDDIKPGIAELLPAFKSFGTTMESAIGPAVQKVSAILSGQFASNMHFIGTVAQELGKWFKADLEPSIAAAEPGFAKLGSVIISDVVPGLAKLWSIGQQVTQHIISAFIPVFEKAVPILVKISGIIAEGLGEGLKFIMPYIIQAAKAIGTFAGEIADRVAPILMQFWNNISVGLDWLEANWKYIWPYLSEILVGFWDEISGVVKIAWALVSGIFKIALDLISGNWGQAWTDMFDMLKGIWGGIQTFVGGAFKVLWGIISGAGAGIWAALTKPFSDAGAFIGKVFGAIGQLVNDIGSGNFGALLGDLGNMPHMAMGGVSSGGLTIVGEHGPEIVALNQGDRVYAHGTGPSGYGSGGGTTEIHNHIYLDSYEMTNILGPRIVTEMRKRVGMRA